MTDEEVALRRTVERVVEKYGGKLGRSPIFVRQTQEHPPEYEAEVSVFDRRYPYAKVTLIARVSPPIKVEIMARFYDPKCDKMKTIDLMGVTYTESYREGLDIIAKVFDKILSDFGTFCSLVILYSVLDSIGSMTYASVVHRTELKSKTYDMIKSFATGKVSKETVLNHVRKAWAEIARLVKDREFEMGVFGKASGDMGGVIARTEARKALCLVRAGAKLGLIEKSIADELDKYLAAILVAVEVGGGS